jgi:uncharacterized protein YdhG (YjbR/CyaY superfamily)
MTTIKTIDAFIAQYPPAVQEILHKLRALVKHEAPEAVEALTYGIPTFKLNGKNLIHFSAFATHIGLYPTPSAIVAFKKELAPYKTAKGSVQFPLSSPIPYELIRKITLFRIRECAK